MSVSISMHELEIILLTENGDVNLTDLQHPNNNTTSEHGRNDSAQGPKAGLLMNHFSFVLKKLAAL